MDSSTFPTFPCQTAPRQTEREGERLREPRFSREPAASGGQRRSALHILPTQLRAPGSFGPDLHSAIPKSHPKSARLEQKKQRTFGTRQPGRSKGPFKTRSRAPRVEASQCTPPLHDRSAPIPFSQRRPLSNSFPTFFF